MWASFGNRGQAMNVLDFYVWHHFRGQPHDNVFDGFHLRAVRRDDADVAEQILATLADQNHDKRQEVDTGHIWGNKRDVRNRTFDPIFMTCSTSASTNSACDKTPTSQGRHYTPQEHCAQRHADPTSAGLHNDGDVENRPSNPAAHMSP